MSYGIDLKGKVAFVAGVADAKGFGWATAKQLANAGATVIVGTWPPMLKKFEEALAKGFGEEATLLDGSTLQIQKVYPIDVNFTTAEEVPDSVRTSKHYVGLKDYDIKACADAVHRDFGRVDILVHSVANGSEVERALLETSRKGYLAASSASAYSMVAMLQNFGPLMPAGGAAVSISFLAAERVVPGYGGGMSSAKAQLESDTRVLAWEAGRKFGIRVNTISAGPTKTRAANAIKKGVDGRPGFIDRLIAYYAANAPLPSRRLATDDVGRAALALCCELTSSVTGTCQYVDNGLHVMGLSVDSDSFEDFIKEQSGRPEWAAPGPSPGEKA